MNADQVSQFIEQVQGLWESHVPAAYQVTALPAAVGMLVVGIGLSVLGARLARFGITCGFAAVGVLVALTFGSMTDVPLLALILIGVLVAGGIGFALFRLWVGLAAAAFLSAVTIAAYGGEVVVPHFLEYEQVCDFDGTFVLPDPIADETADDALSDLETWAHDFWLHVESQETDVNRRLLGVGLGAGLVGLLLGVLLPRFTLVVTSSVLGTVLVMAGLAGLASQLQANLPQAATQHARIVSAAGAVFLLASLLLQALLTRKAPPRVVTRPSK